MTRLVALALFLLAGCREPESTPEDIAADAAADAIADSGLESRIEELEAKLQEVESAGELNQSNIDTLFANDSEIEAFANRTEDRVANMESRLGM